MAIGFVIQFPLAISNSRHDLWVFSERQELQGEETEEESALLPCSLAYNPSCWPAKAKRDKRSRSKFLVRETSWAEAF